MNRRAKSCGKAAPWKPLETGVPTALGNPATDAGFPLSHSFNNNKLDDRDHFQQNAKTSVASLRGLIGSSRNIDRHHSGMLIGFIGIPTAGPVEEADPAYLRRSHPATGDSRGIHYQRGLRLH